MSEGDAAPAIEGAAPNSLEGSVQALLKAAIIDDKICRGLRECIKKIEKNGAEIAILAESCDNESYVKLVEALCAQRDVTLVKVPDGKALGEWAGLCKVDRDGSARKVVGASVVIVEEGINQVALDTFVANCPALSA